MPGSMFSCARGTRRNKPGGAGRQDIHFSIQSSRILLSVELSIWYSPDANPNHRKAKNRGDKKKEERKEISLNEMEQVSGGTEYEAPPDVGGG